MNLNCRAKLPPCAKCEVRTEGCHGKCKAYADWSAELRAENEKVTKARREYYAIDRYQRAHAGKILREKRRKTGKSKL